MKLTTLLTCLALSIASHSALAADRLLTVGGAVTEIVYALGRGQDIIATDTTSYYPEAANQLPKIGYMRTLSAEGLLSMNPAIIIADAGAGPASVLTQIRQAGVKVIQLKEDHSPAHVADNIRQIGRALLVADTERIAQRYEAAWKATQTQVAALNDNSPKHPRVLFILDHTGKSPQAAGHGTAADAVIALAHGSNVMAGQFQGYRSLTAEAVVAAAPDVIVTTSEAITASGGVEAFLSKPGLGMTPAGKARKVVSFDALLLIGFTPRLPYAVGALAAAIRKP